MSKSLHISHITLDSKSVPWLLYIALETPKRQINFSTDLSATVEAPWLGVPSAWPAAPLVPGPLAQFREVHGRFVCALLAHWEILHEFQYGKQFFLRRTLTIIPLFFIHCSTGIRNRMLHTILYLTSSNTMFGSICVSCRSAYNRTKAFGGQVVNGSNDDWHSDVHAKST